MNGVIMINYESNYFPFVRLEKKFFPRKVRWKIEATFSWAEASGQKCLLPSFLRNLFRSLLKTNFVPKGVKDSTIGRAECLIPSISSKLSAQEQISDLFFGL